MDDKTLDRLLKGVIEDIPEVDESRLKKVRKKAEMQQNNKEKLHYYLPILIVIGLDIILITSLTLFLWWCIDDIVVRGIILIGMSFSINIPVITYFLAKEIRSQRENRRGDAR